MGKSADEGKQGATERVVGEPLLSVVLLEGLLPIGRSEFEDAVLWPVGQQVEEVSEVAPGLDVVEIAARDEGDEDGVGDRTIFGADEDPVFSSYSLAAEVSLGDVVRHRQPTVVEKS